MSTNGNPISSKVGATISGVTNTFTVTNPSNTASSAARETIIVGGGTAGDPTLNFNVSGVTNWEMGIDNSDSDKLKISQGTALGTNDVWRMTTAGERTLPLQPLFTVYLNTSLTNLTGNATLYHIIFDTEITDQGGDFNLGTSTFTAPVTGNYLFNVQTRMTNKTTAFDCATVITTSNYRWDFRRDFANIGTPYNIAESPTIITPMTAGDTCIFEIQCSAQTQTIGLDGVVGVVPGAGVITTWASGCLLA